MNNKPANQLPTPLGTILTFQDRITAFYSYRGKLLYHLPGISTVGYRSKEITSDELYQMVKEALDSESQRQQQAMLGNERAMQYYGSNGLERN